MRGQVQTSAARLGIVPARERLAAWADAWVRKRRSQRIREITVRAALASERRRALRSGPVRCRAAGLRPPY